MDAAAAPSRPAPLGRSRGRVVTTAATTAVALVALAPLAAVLVRAAGADAGVWSRVVTARLPGLLSRTGALVLTSTGLAVAIGVPLAWLVVRSDLRGRAVVGRLALVPLAVPPYVAALAAVAVFGPGGLAGSGAWIFGLTGATLGIALCTFPYVFALTADALRRVDPAIEEAARSMGASSIAAFLRVTLPAVRPAIAAGGLLVSLYALSDFGTVSLMRYDTFTRIIYLQLTTRFDRSAAAALSAILAAVAIAVVAGERRLRSRASFAHPGGGAGHRQVRLGRSRVGAYAFVAVVLAASVGLPLGVLTIWAARGVAEAGSSSLAGLAANSLLTSVAAATAGAAAALVVAYRATRRRGGIGRAALVASHAGYAMPGVVVAFGVVTLALRVPPLYGTVAVVVLAYVLRFLPQAADAAHAAFLQVPPSLEEAARSLGERPSGALRRVTLPLVAGGVGTGWALMFLSAMKELPATLVLRPPGFDTLAVRVWSLATEGAYERAAPAALLLILSSLPLLALAMRGRTEYRW